MAFRALQGEPPTAPAIEIRSNGVPVADWRALKRWGNSITRLPAGCEIRYRPRSLWEEHRRIILAALAVFLAQAMTIAALLAQRARRRKAEAETLNHRAELAHVARVSTVGHLASALAHELNQPLGAILRNAEAAELFLQQEKPDLQELRAILSDIRKDDQRAGNVIDRMRALLKRRSFEPRLLSLNEVLKETLAVAVPDARCRHVNLSLETPAHTLSVRGDRIQLQQVLLNLILNGMDAMNGRQNGHRSVTIRAAVTSPGAVEVAVRDTGTGIAPADMPKVFDPFFTTKTNGMGMGLAISRTIIEAHGGKLYAENNNSGGATFRFTLPQEKAAIEN
jgi:C4-dicarboxylate-specific signal transduction histidine kinase